MTDPLKEAAAQLAKQQELIQSLETDRDQWKGLAERNGEKLTTLREALAEALEASDDGTLR